MNYEDFSLFLPPPLEAVLEGIEGFPSGSVVKNLSTNAGDMGLIPGLGRYPGGGNGNPLQYSCLENFMDRGTWRATVHRVAKNWMLLSTWMEKEMATHSSILAWRIPWTEGPGGLQSTGLQRVGHDWATSLFKEYCVGKVKVAQLCLILCNPMDYYSPWNSPDQNTEVGSLSVLQGIFPSQGLNTGLPHCRRILFSCYFQ